MSGSAGFGFGKEKRKTSHRLHGWARIQAEGFTTEGTEHTERKK